MDSFEIRKRYLAYFAKTGHAVVSSSSLIPAEDPTLLFANAGMNQFKDCFLGKEKRSYTRATTSQKCVRAGGKHNDLDAVGFTERHLTFFEMLGNFSFGDYFKEEAIGFAWEFLTKDMQLPKDDLYISVFREDDEAYNIWHKTIGIPEAHLIRLGEKDNFWQMGDTGPCGPCSEIYVDRGATKGCQQPGCAPGCDCSRFTEIWNLVFMQFDRQANGNLVPLTAKGVDTGMGLERLCMVLQGKENVYGTDMMQHLIKKIETLTGINYASSDKNTQAAFNVLTDHVRSSSLIIADGCTPANDGRGYVLRKIIRRAALFAKKLSPDLNIFVALADTFIDQFGGIYPELIASRDLIKKLLFGEIERFTNNLEQGQHILQRYIQENTAAKRSELTGEQIFKLYDTYGFPPELTRVLAHEQNLTLNMTGFEEEMKKQQLQSGKKQKQVEQCLVVTDGISTNFVGYKTTTVESKITFVHEQNDTFWIITEESPFYVESGGQVNDVGTVTIHGATYHVLDLKKVGDLRRPAIAVQLSDAKRSGTPSSPIKVGDMALCWVDPVIRANTVKNHTATHMLQAALMKILGSSIKQAGSLVCQDYLRFDFTHHEALSKEQIDAIEKMINDKIGENISTSISNTTLDDAKSKGVISFFGEKYNPENVRVVQIPGFSAELCGGTHAESTGIIGCFKIVSDSALSSGSRRIVAITGPEALKLYQQTFNSTKKLAELFKVKQDEVIAAVQKLQDDYQKSQQFAKQLKKQLLKMQLPSWIEAIRLVGEIPFLYLVLDDASADELRAIAQEIEKVKPGLYLLVSTEGSSRCNFLAYAAKGIEQKVSLRELGEILKQYNLRGGGNASAIQGGGTGVSTELEVVVTQWLKNK
jgi:alanyl-tRNA synthetase